MVGKITLTNIKFNLVEGSL